MTSDAPRAFSRVAFSVVEVVAITRAPKRRANCSARPKRPWQHRRAELGVTLPAYGMAVDIARSYGRATHPHPRVTLSRSPARRRTPPPNQAQNAARFVAAARRPRAA